ncbi:MAG: N-acetylmuramoyl-L-alanine amidase [Bacillota bacterium]
MIVFIDPGHGGADPGATGTTGLREADVNWDVALKVRQYLQRYGFDARLTRERNESPSQSERRYRAAAARCLVSIHCNSYAEPSVQGLETYAWPGRHDSIALAWMLQESLLVTTARKDRGVKVRNLTVLGGEPPAALVELAFISNPDEEKLLGEQWYREKAALGIAYAVRDFMSLARKK